MGKTIPLAYAGRRRGFAELMNACNSHRVGAATVALGVAACAFDLAREQGACRRIATTSQGSGTESVNEPNLLDHRIRFSR
jgi:hypothetical protein